MTDSAQRPALLLELREAFGDDFVANDQNTRVEILTLVNHCIGNGRVRDLVSILRMVGGPTPEWRRLVVVVDQLFPVEIADGAPPDLLDLLRGTATSSLDEALRDPVIMSYLSTGEPPLYADDAFVALQAFDGMEGGRAQAHFLELLAHAENAHELHRFARLIAQHHGSSDEIHNLCLSLGGELSEATAAQENTAVDTGPGAASTAPSDTNPHTGDDDVTIDTTGTAHSGVVPASLPVIWGGVPPRNRNFVGRETLLDQIQRTLGRYVRATLMPQAQPLHGFGGVGKSQIATEFAYKYQRDYDLIWWVQADDDRAIRRSLNSLARRLGIRESADVDSTIASVLDLLRLGRPYSRWLLIFDNAGDPDQVLPYLPSEGPGDVLITSRSRDWSARPNAIEVPVFTTEESVQLLTAQWRGLTDAQAERLADTLDHLPLALEQAAATHEQTGIPFDEYLNTLAAEPTDVLEEGRPVGYPYPLASAVRLSLERLGASSPAAVELIQVCSFLSAQPISIQMLTRGRGAALPTKLQNVLRGDAIGLRKIVREIGRYALAQIDSGRDLIRIHALVGLLVRDAMTEEQRAAARASAHELLAFANPGSPDNPGNWQQYAQISPHVIPSDIVTSTEPGARRVVLDQVRYLYTIGDYGASLSLCELALDKWEQLDEITLVAKRHRGNALRTLGRYAEAKELNQQTYALMQQQLGVDHEHTLFTAGLVAADLRLAGKFHEARQVDEDTLRRYNDVLGEDDPETLRAAHNLAVDLRILGDFAGAYDLDTRTLSRLVDELGEDHPRTLHTHSSRVRDMLGLGEYGPALAAQLEKFPVQVTLLGPRHGDVILARRNLAILHRKAGDYPAAVEQARSNLDISRDRFGDSNALTLAAMATLVNVLRVSGEIDQAARLGDETLCGYRQALGVDHPFTHAAAVNYAIVLRRTREAERARELTASALERLEQLLGADHPYSLITAANHSNDLAIAEETAQALALSQVTYDRSLQVRALDHPATLACAANLALDLDANGRATEANQLRKSTLVKMTARLGRGHPDTLSMALDQRMETDIEVPTM